MFVLYRNGLDFTVKCDAFYFHSFTLPAAGWRNVLNVAQLKPDVSSVNKPLTRVGNRGKKKHVWF